jgi:hypothetical protein
MSTTTEIFDSCKIVIENDTLLSINGKHIIYEYTPITKKWLSMYLPYAEYDSLLNLAKAIVSNTVEFTHTT